jgi:2-methylisocitrate lyase-like PEP mutase family enzyme
VTRNLRQRLAAPSILVAPGAYDAFTARLIETSKFEAVYFSGAGLSYTSLASPDLGLLTQAEMVDRVRSIANVIDVPLIADGDTGYGNATNVRRTVQLYEQAGASAIQLEDQQFPKRCGHFAGKELIPADEMAGKIRAAVSARESSEFLIIARTDAAGVVGIEAAIERSHKYAEAGADVLFVESPQSESELQTVAQALPDTPLMANMVEGGRTPLLQAETLERLGYSLVIYPNSLTRLFAQAGLELLEELRRSGSTEALNEQMMSFGELNELLDLETFRSFEDEYLPKPNTDIGGGEQS